MKLDVYFTPDELTGTELPPRVVVVDVLRATTTIVEALANGAKAVFPVATAEDAARIAQNVGRDSVLLCGERRALPLEGFDLGNSPAEFTAERVKGLSLVMTTTNGTPAFLSVAESRGGAVDTEATEVLAGAFLNLGAVIRRLGGGEGDAAIVCAGRNGRFALEDAVCAGAAAAGLGAAVESLELNDAALAARSLASRCTGELPRILEGTAAGRHLVEVGLGADLAFCARLDRTDVIPRFHDRKITLE